MINILVVWPKAVWETKQSPARRHQVRAVARRDDVFLVQSGPQWPDWDDDKPGIVNIGRVMPECDVVWWYKPNGSASYPGVVAPREVSRRILTVECWNECWCGTEPGVKQAMHPGGGTVSQEIDRAGTQIAICHHANDMPRVNAPVVAHIPHCAERSVFCKDVEKTRDVILTGVHGGTHYPLRTRWNEMAKRMGWYILRRPPYNFRSVEESDAAVDHYDKRLNESWVKLGCASRWKYALAHYSESAMAGCLGVGGSRCARPALCHVVWERGSVAG